MLQDTLQIFYYYKKNICKTNDWDRVAILAPAKVKETNAT